MTGTQLLEALSFVDEKYIHEADVPLAGRNTPWMKLLSVAACLCILITGVYAYSRVQSKGATESIAEAPAAAAPMAQEPAAAPAESAVEEAAPEAAPRQEAEDAESAAATDAATAAGELQHIPYARLRILSETDEGFAAIVEAVADEPTPLETGMELVVVADPAMVPGANAEIQTDLRKFEADTLVDVENGAYDVHANILYVAELSLAEE